MVNVTSPSLDNVQGAPDLLDFRLNLSAIGNVYRVIKSDEAYYDQFIEDNQRSYTDGSAAVHPDDGSGDGIQAALDACVANRNDYVIVQPSQSDYDLTAALTLSKKSVHLLCPAGMGPPRGATNACRIEQTASDDVFIVSDASIEIAGFYLKHKQNKTAIQVNTGGGYSPNIHHNTIAMNLTSTGAEPLINCTGDGGAYGDIHHNWIFQSGANDSTTIAAIIRIEGSATLARVDYNEITIGDGMTATIGIENLATRGMVAYNIFGGAGDDATWVHCIRLYNWGNAIGNRGVVADSVLVTGGSGTNATYSDNMNGVDGGVIDDAT